MLYWFGVDMDRKDNVLINRNIVNYINRSCYFMLFLGKCLIVGMEKYCSIYWCIMVFKIDKFIIILLEIFIEKCKNL